MEQLIRICDVYTNIFQQKVNMHLDFRGPLRTQRLPVKKLWNKSVVKFETFCGLYFNTPCGIDALNVVWNICNCSRSPTENFFCSWLLTL